MSPCDSCHAGCCRAFAVPVTGADILRMQRDLGLSFWEIAIRWADPEGAIAKGQAPHFRFADEPRTPFVICLRHEESALHAGTTKCRFLVEHPPDHEHPFGVARCGIYESRPSACRAFPTRLGTAGDLVILHDVPQSGRVDDHPAYRLCPRPWETSEVDPIQSAADLVVARYEMAFFRQLAAAWNRRPQSMDVFADFIRLVYSQRVQRAAADEESRDADDGPRLLKFPVRTREAQIKAA